jgi:hypothetical protein
MSGAPRDGGSAYVVRLSILELHIQSTLRRHCFRVGKPVKHHYGSLVLFTGDRERCKPREVEDLQDERKTADRWRGLKRRPQGLHLPRGV